MALTALSRQLQEVVEITEKCFIALQERSVSELNELLEKRAQLLVQLEKVVKNSLSDIKSEDQKQFYRSIFEKITKESQRLVEYIDREKKGVVQDIKQLQNGRRNLEAIKQKLKKSRFISKII